MALETKQVLITVMTYPSPSRKYVEIVCCAGIDLASGSWIRLYPVPYREVVPISVEGAMATPGCMLRAPELLGNSLLLAVIL